MRYAFVRTYTPVLDGAPYRAFDTMEQYRRWCEATFPTGWDMAAFESPAKRRQTVKKAVSRSLGCARSAITG